MPSERYIIQFKCLLLPFPIAPENPEVGLALLPLADDWWACIHRTGTSGACDQPLVMKSVFCFPCTVVASCDKLHLGCDAVLPWGWDNSFLGTVANLRRSASPREENPVSPCVHPGLGRAAANAIRWGWGLIAGNRKKAGVGGWTSCLPPVKAFLTCHCSWRSPWESKIRMKSKYWLPSFSLCKSWGTNDGYLITFWWGWTKIMLADRWHMPRAHSKHWETWAKISIWQVKKMLPTWALLRINHPEFLSVWSRSWPPSLQPLLQMNQLLFLMGGSLFCPTAWPGDRELRGTLIVQ